MPRSLVPSLNEYIDRILKANDQVTILQDALCYYNSVDLWCLDAEITGDANRGKINTMLDLARSHLFWNKFIAPKANSKDFIERFKIPHIEVDETVQLYRRKFGELDNDAKSALAVGNDLLQSRRKWEFRLLHPTQEAFIEYIEWEKVPELKTMLFNRAVSVFPQSFIIWHKWIQSSWDEALPIVERASMLCECSSIHTTRLLFGLESKIQTTDQKLAHLCYLVSRLHEHPREEPAFLTIATNYVESSNDPEFIGNVMVTILTVERNAAENLWVLKSDAMYAEFFQWLRLSALPDITIYFEAVLAIKATNSVSLKEHLKAHLALGITQHADATFTQLRHLAKSQSKSSDGLHKDIPIQSSAASQLRNRECTSFIVSGTASKSELCDKLDDTKVISSQHFDGYHIFEMASEQDKKIAIAALSFSQKISGTTVYDAKETTLWVTGYEAHWSQTDLHKLFSQFGTLLAIRMPNTQGRRFCYVQYATTQDALRAIEGAPAKFPSITVKLSDPASRKVRAGAVEEGRLVYVSGFDFNTSKEQLSAWLSTHSMFSPDRMTIPSSKVKEREHDGYAFVEFSTSAQAQEAVNHFNTLDHAGRPVRANLSRKKRRLENPHHLTVENVYDENKLRQLVGGEVKFNEQTHVAHLLFESEKEVGKAMLKVRGKEIAGHTLRIQSELKPKVLRR